MSLFASGGRDRLVHVFLPEDGYHHAETIEDHQSSIVSIKFGCVSSDIDFFKVIVDRFRIVIASDIKSKVKRNYSSVDKCEPPITFRMQFCFIL